MTREDAMKIIEDFGKAGGNMFIDGSDNFSNMSDSDIITIAYNIQLLKKRG